MITNDKRIEAIERRIKQLSAQKQQVEARKRAEESKRKRSDDLRRKILVGSVMLARAQRDESSARELHKILDGTLVKADERELFGLSQRGADADAPAKLDSSVQKPDKPSIASTPGAPSTADQVGKKRRQGVESTLPASGPDSLF